MVSIFKGGREFLDLRSRVPGILGPREREFFLQERENEKHKKVGTLILRSSVPEIFINVCENVSCTLCDR